MGYQIWIKDYGDVWKRKDCDTEKEAKDELLEEIKAGKDVLLTTDIPFELTMTFKPAADEVKTPKSRKVDPKQFKQEEVDNSGVTESGYGDDQDSGG